MPNPHDADLPARIDRAMAYVARWCERRLAEGVLDPHNYGRAVDALLKSEDTIVSISRCSNESFAKQSPSRLFRGAVQALNSNVNHSSPKNAWSESFIWFPSLTSHSQITKTRNPSATRSPILAASRSRFPLNFSVQ